MSDPILPPEVLAVGFPKLDDAQVNALESVGTRRRLADHEFLFHTVDTDLSLFVLLSGEVEIFDLHNGRENLVVVSGPRDFVGDVSMLIGGAAVISARCRGEVELIEVTARELRRVLAEMTLVSTPIVHAFMARRARLESGAAAAPSGWRLLSATARWPSSASTTCWGLMLDITGSPFQ